MMINDSSTKTASSPLHIGILVGSLLAVMIVLTTRRPERRRRGWLCPDGRRRCRRGGSAEIPEASVLWSQAPNQSRQLFSVFGGLWRVMMSWICRWHVIEAIKPPFGFLFYSRYFSTVFFLTKKIFFFWIFNLKRSKRRFEPSISVVVDVVVIPHLTLPKSIEFESPTPEFKKKKTK